MIKKIRVLMLSNFFNDAHDNCYRIRYLTAEKLSNNKHLDITIISPAINAFRYSNNKIRSNFKVVETPGLFPVALRRGGFSLGDLLFKTLNILINKYDIIHVDAGHRPAAIFPALIGKALCDSKIIDEWWEWYGKGGISDTRTGALQQLVNLYDKATELPFVMKYDGVIAISSILRERLRGTKVDKNTIILHGGAENNTLRDYPIQEARSELKLDLKSIIVGMVNLSEEDEEDNLLFLESFERLVKEYNSLRMMVTGRSDYIVNEFLQRCSFKDRIIYPGWVEHDLYNLYLSSCDFFVLPLRNNLRNAARWPNKLCDYFVVNRPVLTNPTGDIKELFTQYQLGILCSESVEDFYEKAKLCIENKAALGRYCSDQKQYASKELDFDARVDRLITLYLDLLKCG